MIIDAALHISRDQALTETAVSTDHIDLSADRDIGPAGQKYLVVTSKAAPGGTSPTIAISIETDDNASFSSATTIAATGTLAAAAFALGTRVVVPFPYANERYIRARYTLGGTSPTFTADAFLTSHEPPARIAYPDASTV